MISNYYLNKNLNLFVMSNTIKYTLSILFCSLIALTSCKKEDKTFGELTTPDKPVIDVQVVGKTTAAPFGDSTGKIIVTITSANAINYKVNFGESATDSLGTKNVWSYSYSHTGLKSFVVTVTTTGKGGVASTSTSTSFSVYKKFTPSAELVTMLTNDASKTWKVDSTAYGHFGVGPANSFNAEWWNAPANDKAGLGIYDDEYTFTKIGNLFAHKTNNSIFGKKEFLTDFDPSLTGAGDFTLLGATAANYNDGFGYTGDATSESIVFFGKGHLGLYVGAHVFKILNRSATNMTLRYIGKDGNAWYVKIKAK
jgi:hypothetical protein